MCVAADGSPFFIDLRYDVSIHYSVLRLLPILLIQIFELPFSFPYAGIQNRTEKKSKLNQNFSRSSRVALKMAPGSSIKRQQRLLISRLGIACEREQISKDALQAYIKLFEQELSQEHISAILSLFGWEPSALPLIGEELVEGAA